MISSIENKPEYNSKKDLITYLREIGGRNHRLRGGVVSPSERSADISLPVYSHHLPKQSLKKFSKMKDKKYKYVSTKKQQKKTKTLKKCGKHGLEECANVAEVNSIIQKTNKISGSQRKRSQSKVSELDGVNSPQMSQFVSCSILTSPQEKMKQLPEIFPQERAVEPELEKRKASLKTNIRKRSVSEEHSETDLDSEQGKDLNPNDVFNFPKRKLTGVPLLPMYSLKDNQVPLSCGFRQSLASFRMAYDSTPDSAKRIPNKQTKSAESLKASTRKSWGIPAKPVVCTLNDNCSPPSQLRASGSRMTTDSSSQKVTHRLTKETEHNVKQRGDKLQEVIDPHMPPLNVTYTVEHNRRKYMEELQESIDSDQASLSSTSTINNEQQSLLSHASGPSKVQTRPNPVGHKSKVAQLYHSASDSDDDDLKTDGKQKLSNKFDCFINEDGCVEPISSPSKPAALMNPVTNDLYSVVCVKTTENCVIHNKLDLMGATKCFNMPTFSSGNLILGPMVEKSLQYVYLDTVVFYIVRGLLLVTLHCTNYKLKSGDHFFVPPGNMYSIRNLLNEEAVLVYTQIKGDPLVFAQLPILQ
ncbi:centromere protein C isoform X3 [Rhinatrema bivittatum]|uniref:centromere protein C isoform X3 n=1 Tax=Rhinatrema bivittatum TaxID=194408 RepID=UPI00112A6192|nr:centromere protein C isoform X3 [Rhinatrema bivittatum]